MVENSLYRIVFTNRGAQAKSWILKKYKDEDGNPLDLVNKDATKFGLPLSLYTYDKDLRNQINSALYVAVPTGNVAAPATLTYEYADDDVTVHKTFQFGDTYVVSIETDVTQNGKPIEAYPACGRRASATRPTVRCMPRLASTIWPTAKWNGSPPRKSATATLFMARSTGPGRRTSSSPPSSCPTIRTRRRW